MKLVIENPNPASMRHIQLISREPATERHAVQDNREVYLPAVSLPMRTVEVSNEVPNQDAVVLSGRLGQCFATPLECLGNHQNACPIICQPVRVVSSVGHISGPDRALETCAGRELRLLCISHRRRVVTS